MSPTLHKPVFWLIGFACVALSSPARSEDPLPADHPFRRAMELEVFAANPLKWSKDYSRRKTAEAARIQAVLDEVQAARRKAFESFMMEEWIAGDPADAIKVQRESMQSLLSTIESQKETIETLRGEHKKSEESVGSQIAEVMKALEELRKATDDNRKANEARGEEITKSAEDLKKGLDGLRGELRGMGKRHQEEINLLRARGMRDFESAEFDGMVFIKIPAGKFRRGTTPEQIDALTKKEMWNRLNESETPAREISITRPFLIARFEVSQKTWKDIMDKNPAAFQGGEFPIESISWNEIPEFIKRLGQRTGGRYRLPTEAEWEYCARAGSDGLFSLNESGEISFETIGEFAVMSDNSENRTKPCGARKPNAWGLHDMHGNVWEWCQDIFQRDFYARSPESDPLCSDAGTERVFRGGSWALEAQFQRAGLRGGNLPDYKSQYVGFRLVREID